MSGIEQTIEQEIGLEHRPRISGSEVAWAILSYLGVGALLPFSLKRRSPFINYHLRQGLVLLIVEIVSTFIFIIPLVGWMAGLFGWMTAMIFSFWGAAAAARKRYWSTPVLSRLAQKIKL